MLFRSLLLLLTASLLGASHAAAQTATYARGSIYDLLPPMQQTSGNMLLEALVLSKRQHRMKEIYEYSEQDVLRQLGRPVGRLAMNVRSRDGTDKIAYCTVSLVAEGMILTNHHCIQGNPEGKVTDALLWMGFLTSRHDGNVRQYGVELAPVEASAELDYAIHRVRGEPGKQWGTIRFGETVNIYDRQSLFIIHHPAGDRQHITLGDCQTGRPATEGDDLLHICDTIGGSSGAPVFDNNSRQVVGLHYRAVDVGKLNAAKRLDRVVAQSRTLRGLLQERAGATVKTAAAEVPPTPAARPAPPAPPAPRCDGIEVPVGQANTLQCVRPGSGQRFRDCPTCPEMVVAPSGEFMMGSTPEEIAAVSKERPDRAKFFKWEEPRRKVSIARPFAVGRTHITRGEFAAFVMATGHKMDGGCRIYDGKEWKLDAARSWRSPGFEQTDAHPVVCVNWQDATAFAAWVSQRSGKSYRLLSESEAEYVARATTRATRQPRFFFGDDYKDLCTHGNGADRPSAAKFNWDLKHVAPCDDGFVYTAPVASFKANAWGLHDVHGNAWTWTEDCFADSYVGAPSDGSARTTGECVSRVLRGGSWGYRPQNLRAAGRNGAPPGNRGDGIGFRLARTLNPSP
jgi:formylglycine-generating enzyme required for sulfatase activity